MPKISAVIPVYNHQDFIADCIQSVLNQTYKDFEIIVIDDGSTDSTPEIIYGFGDKVKYVRQQNRGVAAALNTAIRHSAGEYIAWLSSDDAFMPTKLNEQINFLNKNPDIDIVYTDFYYIDSTGKIISTARSPYYEDKREFLCNMLISNFINGCSIMFKRTCIDKVGYFDENMKYHADGDMWFRMLKHFKFGHIPKPLLRYRWHTSNLTHNFKETKSFFYIYYKKIFELYNVSDFFEKGTYISNAYLKIALILEKRRLYNMAFSYLVRAIKLNTMHRLNLKLIIQFILLLPVYIMVDMALRVFCWEQRHFGSNFIAKIYFKLNNSIANVK